MHQWRDTTEHRGLRAETLEVHASGQTAVCHLLAVWLGTSSLTCLYLSFCVCTNGPHSSHTRSEDCCNDWSHTHKMLRTKAWDRKDSINMGSYIFHLLLLIKVAVLAHFIDKKAEAGGNEVTLTCTSGGHGVWFCRNSNQARLLLRAHNPSCPATQNISQI